MVHLGVKKHELDVDDPKACFAAKIAMPNIKLMKSQLMAIVTEFSVRMKILQ